MASLQERVAARRREREQERSFVLPVTGYEDVLAARYQVLPYEDLRDIGKRNAAIEGTAEGELAVFAGTLARACVEVLGVNEDGSYQSLGSGWSAYGVREHLGIELPEGSNANDALHAIFNGPSGGTDLAIHFAAYDAACEKPAERIGEEQAGESEPSAEGSSK